VIKSRGHPRQSLIKTNQIQGGTAVFSPDQDYSHEPYQLLIRARTQAQLERAIIIIASRIAAKAVSIRVSEKLAPVAAKTVARVALSASEATGRIGRAPSATRVVSALQLVADFDDWCGTPWRKPWPWPWPGPWQEVKDPHPDPWRESGLFDVAVLKVVIGLAKLTPEVGGELAETSQGLLKEMVG
jgi:hypothetical protein